MSAPTPLALSIVIPVFNEAQSLGPLHTRLTRTLEKIGRPYEIVFVDDGSRDESSVQLRALRARDGAVRVIRFTRNYGQHAALLAGMERARGEVIVTLDADLQNPPEEIPRLLAALVDGVDVVGGRRVSRRDPWTRRAASWLVNRAASVAVGVLIARSPGPEDSRCGRRSRTSSRWPPGSARPSARSARRQGRTPRRARGS